MSRQVLVEVSKLKAFVSETSRLADEFELKGIHELATKARLASDSIRKLYESTAESGDGPLS